MRENIFGIRLKELRLDLDISQRKLGDIFGVCNQTISFWESGSREPDLDTICSIAKFFDVSVDFLLGLKDY